MAVFVVLAVASALLIVLVIFFWRRSAKAALLANKFEHQEMTERKEGSKNIIVALITLFSSQFFQMLKMIRTFIYGINLCIIPAMNVARKEIKALIPQRLHIPSTQLRLLDIVEHGNEANDVASYSDTVFCCIIL